MPHRLHAEEFDALVARAVEELPEVYLQRVRNSNIDIVVETKPSAQQLRNLRLRPHETLFGLYEGVSLPERTRYGNVLPDKITIFQEPLETHARSLDDLELQITKTVRHELAHLFGFDEHEIEEMGLG